MHRCVRGEPAAHRRAGRCLGAGPDGKPELKLVLNRPYPAVASLGGSLTVGETTGGVLPVWREVNDACRGEGDDAACRERDEIMEQHAYASAAQFLAAWRAGDAERMRELSTADAQMLSDPLVPDLLRRTPAEDEFDMRYDVVNSGTVGGYISDASGVDLYFRWTDDIEKGWLVTSVAPDVG